MSAVRHKASTKALAVKMRQGGWSLNEIRRYLAEHGVVPTPSVSTIQCWTDPAQERKQREHKRLRERKERAQASTFAWPGERSDEWKLARMRRLSGAGLSTTAIAKVMAIDFPGTVLSEHQVWYMLKTGKVTRAIEEPTSLRELPRAA